MRQPYFERLSPADAGNLEFEDANAHMHIGAVAIFDADPVQRPGDGLDFERVTSFVGGRLDAVPRFRQKIARIPRLDVPVWVDDESFNLLYHVRHTALPAPGDERQLKRLTGRVMSQQLDRGKPLWELWFVEGLEGGRFAMISKVHHCLADGIAGVNLLSALLAPSPSDEIEPATPFHPRPAPSPGRMLADELGRRAGRPFAAVRDAVRTVGGAIVHPDESWNELRDGLHALRAILGSGLSQASPTPLDGQPGPHRRFDWARVDFRTLRNVGKALGGTVNDAALELVTAALREVMVRRDIRPETLDFRVSVPVSVRTSGQRGELGNRTTAMNVPLPLDEPNPRIRLQRIIESTRDGKDPTQIRILAFLADLEGAQTALLWAMAHGRASNIAFTSVPGPRVPQYLLGARMRDVYPVVPLIPIHSLGIAAFGYDGGLFFGLNSDWDKIYDLHEIAELIPASLEALCKAVPEAAQSADAAPE